MKMKFSLWRGEGGGGGVGGVGDDDDGGDVGTMAMVKRPTTMTATVGGGGGGDYASRDDDAMDMDSARRRYGRRGQSPPSSAASAARREGGWREDAGTASTRRALDFTTTTMTDAAEDDVAMYDDVVPGADVERDDVRGVVDGVDYGARVREVLAEARRARRRAAGVDGVDAVDVAVDEDMRGEMALRVAIERARVRAKMAHAEAVALRRRAQEERERFKARFGDDAFVGEDPLCDEVNEWYVQMCDRLAAIPPMRSALAGMRYADDARSKANLAPPTWLHLDVSPTKVPLKKYHRSSAP